jgi:hypothetical protein
VYWRIHDVSQAIRELTEPGDPIFDFSNQPAFYFFADRPNATRFYQVPILSPRRFQEETIRALESQKPKVVIRRSPELFDQFDGVTNDLRAQAVAAYLDDAYAFHRAVRGVELWTRRGVAAQPVATYLARIRVPSRKELVGSGLDRLVFPGVGSTPGPFGAFWQSDLTIHNPFREPMPLRIRYVLPDGGTDRTIRLAGRQTIRWPDVVRTLFGLQGGVGTLWIEHREGLAPVAVVKTADVGHGADASLQMPLSRRDAASSGSDHPELAVVGIPAAARPGRRINIGVVNIGRIPATFRFAVTTRTGAVAGREFETGVPEETTFVLNDAEQQLGTAIDETMTLRVTAIAGTGVGFATIIDADGNSELIPAVPAQQR